MINQFSSYILKTNQLEDEIEELKQNTYFPSSPSCVCINQNFSNLEVIYPKKIFISHIDIEDNSNIFFQGQVEILANASMSVCVSFIVNSVVIQKVEKTVFQGNNIFSIYCNFAPINSERVNIYDKIEQSDNVAVYLQNVSLFAWGTLKNVNESEYQIYNLGDSYLVTLLANHMLYSKTISKQNAELSFLDFNFVDYATSYSYSHQAGINKTYLFRVDQNKNLFGGDMITNEFLIEKNVSCVTSMNVKNETHVFFVQDGKCYEIIIDDKQNMSSKKLIETAGVNPQKVSCYYSDVEGKLYLILTDKNNSNYLLVQSSEAAQDTQNIRAEYNILIETQGGI